MKSLALLPILALMISACGGRTGMSSSLTEDAADSRMQTQTTLPDFDFTDSTPEPDLNVPTPDQMPDETTTTTTTTLPVALTTTTSSTSTTVLVTTTTVLVTTTTTTMEPPESGDLDFEPTQLIPGAKKEDFVGSATLSPTIFFKAIINENLESNSCAVAEKISVLVSQGGSTPEELTKICKKNYLRCLQEGSCVVTQGDKQYPLNVVGKNDALHRYIFTIIDVKRCPYGYGPGEKCLDPYYSVAADLTVYKTGDVIFVPAVVGLDMGNGTKHHGFFVVRDMGGKIKGRGRFDFFTGYHTDTDPKNLFKKLGLGDVNTKLKYYLLKNPGKLNSFVKKMRNYPNLPKSQLN